MLYGVARLIARFLMFLLYSARIRGTENIPESGPVIICSNHIGSFDPAVLAVRVRRPIHFVAKKELFKNKFIAWLLKRLNAISVDRKTNDMVAYRAISEVLKGGGLVGIFAQGTRIKEVDAKDAKSGVALFAVKNRALVVPAFIDSEYKFRGRMNISFGAPISFEEHYGKPVKAELLGELTEGIMARVIELRDVSE